MVYKLLLAFLACLVVACSEAPNEAEKAQVIEEKPEARTSPKDLSIEQLRVIKTECESTGKMATDDYCKEVAYVYEKRFLSERRQQRLKKTEQELATPAKPYVPF